MGNDSPSLASMPSTGSRLPRAAEARRAYLATQLRVQAGACRTLGSELYALLLERAAGDAHAGGPCWGVLAPHLAPGRGGALALRLMAAVHRLVLTGAAPGLAAHYPSVGGQARGEATWRAFQDTVEAHADALTGLVGRPCQTNEVGRAAALAAGFLDLLAWARRPLRLLELGASAGLNLRWERFRYGGGGACWGDPLSPVDLTGLWSVPPPRRPPSAAVVERRGCDTAPVDPHTAAGRLDLAASVWADQPERLARLDAAIAVAEAVPAAVELADAAEWLPARLAEPAPGVLTVIYHSVLEEYLSEHSRLLLLHALGRAGRGASPAAPVAWLRLEPASELRQHALRCTRWPGGWDHELARCDAHGGHVVWCAGPAR